MTFGIGVESIDRISSAPDLVWPFYIVCDVSRSMWDESTAVRGDTPHDILNDSLASAFEALARNASVAGVARLAVVAFADDAQTHLPLTSLNSNVVLDVLPKGYQTDYRRVWEHLNALVRADTKALAREGLNSKKPVIYFLTDGVPVVDRAEQPREVWMAEYRKLCDPAYEDRPRVVVIGLGQAERSTLLALRSTDPAGGAYLAENEVNSGDLVSAVIKVITASIRSSSRNGQFSFRPPPGMKRLDE